LSGSGTHANLPLKGLNPAGSGHTAHISTTSGGAYYSATKEVYCQELDAAQLGMDQAMTKDMRGGHDTKQGHEWDALITKNAAGHLFDAWDPLLQSAAWEDFNKAYNQILTVQAAPLEYISENPYENVHSNSGVSVL
jgi:Ca2+-binding EF-hand superfamily protein